MYLNAKSRDEETHITNVYSKIWSDSRQNPNTAITLARTGSLFNMTTSCQFNRVLVFASWIRKIPALRHLRASYADPSRAEDNITFVKATF